MSDPPARQDGHHRPRDIREGMRFAGLLLATSSILAVLKVGVGVLTGSHALLASALYSVNDVLSSIAVAVSMRVGARRPDAQHPYGYGKAEFIAVGMVSLSIAIGVFLMFVFSLVDVLTGVDGPPHVAAMLLAALSMGVSWWLARKGARLAADMQSPALSTSSDHHHADALGSLAALFGIGGALLGFHALDRLVAIFETLHIVGLSGTLLARSVTGLMDVALPDEDVELITAECMGIAPIERVARIRSRRVGKDAWVDVAVTVPSGLSVASAHEAAEQVQLAIRRVLGPDSVAQVRFQGPDFVETVPGPGGSPHG